jgi:hypothetical protein
MSNGGGGRVEGSRGNVQGSMLKRGATQGDCRSNPSTLTLFSPFTLAKCETSWALHRVINLMAHGLHNWAFSRVFAEVYRSLELGIFGTWDLQIQPNFGKLRDKIPPVLCKSVVNLTTLSPTHEPGGVSPARNISRTERIKIRDIREIRGSDQHPDFSYFSYFSHPGRTTDDTDLTDKRISGPVDVGRGCGRLTFFPRVPHCLRNWALRTNSPKWNRKAHHAPGRQLSVPQPSGNAGATGSN